MQIMWNNTMDIGSFSGSKFWLKSAGWPAYSRVFCSCLSFITSTRVPKKESWRQSNGYDTVAFKEDFLTVHDSLLQDHKKTPPLKTRYWPPIAHLQKSQEVSQTISSVLLGQKMSHWTWEEIALVTVIDLIHKESRNWQMF